MGVGTAYRGVSGYRLICSFVFYFSCVVDFKILNRGIIALSKAYLVVLVLRLLPRQSDDSMYISRE
jgi:hypothetical protein